MINEQKCGQKVAVYTGTRNLYPHMVVAAKSLIANSDVDRIYFLIEDNKFPEELPSIIKTRNISGQKFFDMRTNPNAKSRFTYMAMIRVAFTKIFPELDKILSLDVDTIAIKDVSQIWNIPIDDKYFSAVHGDDGIGWNAGVMLQNLKVLRNTHMDDFLIDKLNEEEIKFLDQTVYNNYCKDAVTNMDPGYNVNRYCLPSNDHRIIHYAGEISWDNKPEYLEYKAKSWGEILKSRKERYGI